MKNILYILVFFTLSSFAQEETAQDSIPPINNSGFKKLSNEELMLLDEDALDEYFTKLSEYEEQQEIKEGKKEYNYLGEEVAVEEFEEEEFVKLTEEELDKLSDIELEEYYDKLAMYESGEFTGNDFEELTDEELANMTDEELQEYYEKQSASKSLSDYTPEELAAMSEEEIAGLYAEEDDMAGEYSIFDDFRIPKRNNISNTALIADGWETKPYNYAFRCRNKLRIRMTYWERASEDGEIISDFINISPMPGKCRKEDKKYFDIDLDAEADKEMLNEIDDEALSPGSFE